ADKFCKLCSYKEFKFHELIQLKNTDIKPNEYISIWEWVIYIEFARLILDDNSISHQDEWKKLKKFFDRNFYSSKLDAMKILEITKQN
ncbi:hypothetical protein CHH67_25830, partial [Paenibacillus campinasensis]